jgi:hypothetical protein
MIMIISFESHIERIINNNNHNNNSRLRLLYACIEGDLLVNSLHVLRPYLNYITIVRATMISP